MQADRTMGQLSPRVHVRDNRNSAARVGAGEIAGRFLLCHAEQICQSGSDQDKSFAISTLNLEIPRLRSE